MGFFRGFFFSTGRGLGNALARTGDARSGLFTGEDGVEKRRGGGGGGTERERRGVEMRKQMPALGIDAISSVSQLMTNSAEGKRVERRARSDSVSEKIKMGGKGKKKTRAGMMGGRRMRT